MAVDETKIGDDGIIDLGYPTFSITRKMSIEVGLAVELIRQSMEGLPMAEANRLVFRKFIK